MKKKDGKYDFYIVATLCLLYLIDPSTVVALLKSQLTNLIMQIGGTL